MPDPTRFLGDLLILLGTLGLMAGLVLWRFPAAVRQGLAVFPRSKWPGWILAAVDLFWVTWVMRHAALGWFEPMKPLIPLLGLLTFGAIVWFLDELLAPRALGGLLILLANPMLNGVRWSDSAWRFAVVAIAYIWVLAGCLLVLHPWSFRKLAGKFLSSPAWMRAAALEKLLAGAILLMAGLTYFH